VEELSVQWRSLCDVAVRVVLAGSHVGPQPGVLDERDVEEATVNATMYSVPVAPGGGFWKLQECEDDGDSGISSINACLVSVGLEGITREDLVAELEQHRDEPAVYVRSEERTCAPRRHLHPDHHPHLDHHFDHLVTTTIIVTYARPWVGGSKAALRRFGSAR
jgi:hypothetical protein